MSNLTHKNILSLVEVYLNDSTKLNKAIKALDITDTSETVNLTVNLTPRR